MTPTTFRDWRAEMPSSGATDATTSGTDTYDSKSQGKLTVTGGLDKESGAIQVDDRQPVSVEKPSATKTPTAKPATPTSLTVPRPSFSTQNRAILVKLFGEKLIKALEL